MYLGLAVRHQGWQLRAVSFRLRWEDVASGNQERNEDHRKSYQVWLDSFNLFDNIFFFVFALKYYDAAKRELQKSYKAWVHTVIVIVYLIIIKLFVFLHITITFKIEIYLSPLVRVSWK